MVSGKHFVNDVTHPVRRALCNVARGAPDLCIRLEEQIVYRKLPHGHDKVILLSGGGSGHEPAHTGCVGEGMLDVAVAGNIFASPSASQVLKGLRVLEAPRGALMIVKNYTGDKLNFGLAGQKAKAQGLEIETVFVGDDVSVMGGSAVGRRGLAGVLFVHKIAGAAANRGADLAAVANIARKVTCQMGTAAVSLDRCSLLRRGAPESLPHDEIEFGMGIHNEPGVRREKLRTLDVTVNTVLDTILKPRADTWMPTPGQPVAVMVNNLGGLSILELSVIAEEVRRQLDARDIEVARSMSGTFVSSLDGPGFSVTLLGLDDELMSLLDAPTAAPAWPRTMSFGWKGELESQEQTGASDKEIICPIRLGPKVSKSRVMDIIHSIEKRIIEDEPCITKYDLLAGDGDCGETLLNGIQGLVAISKSLPNETVDLSSVFREAASVAENSMGGTSGAIYAIYINAVASSLENMEKTMVSPSDTSISKCMAIALQGGLEELYKYTLARQGHRTLMDALIPFVETFCMSLDFREATLAAQKGCEDTRMMEASLGRASYVGRDRFVENSGIPDPGALGIVSILKGIRRAL